MKKDTNASTTVFVLHHTNQGTPESGEIHSIYTSIEAAEAAMAAVLEEDYNGTTLHDNEINEFVYMYISEQDLKK